jgi:hypothetical protein
MVERTSNKLLAFRAWRYKMSGGSEQPECTPQARFALTSIKVGSGSREIANFRVLGLAALRRVSFFRYASEGPLRERRKLG